MSSTVEEEETPKAVASPIAGSASIAKIFLSGYLSDNKRTVKAEIEVLPTPPLPQNANIFVLPITLFAFAYDEIAIHQIGLQKSAFEVHLPLHDVGESEHAIFAFDIHDVLHEDVLLLFLILIYSGYAHKLFL